MSGGVSPVGTFAITDVTSETPTQWFSGADANSAVVKRPADMFAPHPTSPTSMNVVLDPGFVESISVGGQSSVTEVAQATLAISAAPGSPNNRIDLVYVDMTTGAGAVLAGTPATSPSAPALPAGKRQVALVSVPNGTVAIGASNLTDIRSVWGAGINALGVPWAIAGGTPDAILATYTPSNGSLFDGLLLSVRATAPNASTTPTFKPDALTAHTITKDGGAPLAGSDIPGQYAEIFLRYNLANTRWELINPAQLQPAPINNNTISSNISGSSAKPIGNTLSAILDSVLGGTRGAIIVRGASTWGLIGPGTNGQVPQSNGTDIAMATLNLTPAPGSVHQGAINNTSSNLSYNPGVGLGGVSIQANPGGAWALGLVQWYQFVNAGSYGAVIYGGINGDGSTSFTPWQNTSGSPTNYVSLVNNSTGSTDFTFAACNYINASPPYNLGDGDMRGFVFAQLEKGSGKVIAIWSAQEGPWIYNGPTSVVPHRIDEKGRKFRRVPVSAVPISYVASGKSTLSEYLTASRETREEEITQATYHADMHLIPHPFFSYDPRRHIVVLLDPMHDLVSRFCDGEREEVATLHTLLYGGRIKIGNEPLNRRGPPGVMQVRILD